MTTAARSAVRPPPLVYQGGVQERLGRALQQRQRDGDDGQFTSADTLLAGGLNHYAYVGGDPETATDPVGHVRDATLYDEGACGLQDIGIGNSGGGTETDGPSSGSGRVDDPKNISLAAQSSQAMLRLAL